MHQTSLSAYAARNRELWDQQVAEYQKKHNRDRDWARRWPMEHIWRVRKL